MTKAHIKMIMELIFIFILPLGIILASISCEKEMTYDENGNQLTEEKHIEYNNVILNEGSGNYINKMIINEVMQNNTRPFENITFWFKGTGSNVFTTTAYGGCLYKLITNKGYSYDYLRNNFANLNELHKYLIKLIYSTNKEGIFIRITTPNVDTQIQFQENLLYTQDGHGIDPYWEVYTKFFTPSYNTISNLYFFYDNGTTTNTTGTIYIQSVELIDLTDMFGSGFEPTTIQEYNTYVNNQVFNYSQNGEIIEYLGSTQISENVEEDLTIWGKLKNLIIENLQLTDNIIVDIILSYTIIWFIMFIIWHFFYLFFDGLVHIFIDWGHKERKKVE